MKLKTILLVDDNQNDVELTILAFKEFNLANKIEVAEDGVEAMQYLRSQGRFKGRKPGNPHHHKEKSWLAHETTGSRLEFWCHSRLAC